MSKLNLDWQDIQKLGERIDRLSELHESIKDGVNASDIYSELEDIAQELRKLVAIELKRSEHADREFARLTDRFDDMMEHVREEIASVRGAQNRIEGDLRRQRSIGGRRTL